MVSPSRSDLWNMQVSRTGRSLAKKHKRFTAEAQRPLSFSKKKATKTPIPLSPERNECPRGWKGARPSSNKTQLRSIAGDRVNDVVFARNHPVTGERRADCFIRPCRKNNDVVDRLRHQ